MFKFSFFGEVRRAYDSLARSLAQSQSLFVEMREAHGPGNVQTADCDLAHDCGGWQGWEL